MLKTYEVTFTIEATSSKDVEERLDRKGYIWLPNTTIRELIQDENLPKYIGKTITILDYRAVADNSYIYERNGFMGLLQGYEGAIYKIKSLDTPWKKYDWFICDESIDELLELGAITITS